MQSWALTVQQAADHIVEETRHFGMILKQAIDLQVWRFDWDADLKFKRDTPSYCVLQYVWNLNGTGWLTSYGRDTIWGHKKLILE